MRDEECDNVVTFPLTDRSAGSVAVLLVEELGVLLVTGPAETNKTGAHAPPAPTPPYTTNPLSSETATDASTGRVRSMGTK